ncbi:MAG: hypothetical protein II458_07335 [Oscillospiraceae bacterium]|nr:hypothetical protein [Oscillospiraceae bacterium]
MDNMIDTMKDLGKKAKEFVEENKELVLIIAGAIAAVAAICAVVALLRRKK